MRFWELGCADGVVIAEGPDDATAEQLVADADLRHNNRPPRFQYAPCGPHTAREIPAEEALAIREAQAVVEAVEYPEDPT